MLLAITLTLNLNRPVVSRLPGAKVQPLTVFLPSKRGGVRPLNVTNSDNRLLASAIRITLELVIEPLITLDQRGFLSGPSMLANLLDVDEAMLHTTTQGEKGVAFFFDFAAAFPSQSMSSSSSSSDNSVGQNGW